jgi:hypothetical protein
VIEEDSEVVTEETEIVEIVVIGEEAILTADQEMVIDQEVVLTVVKKDILLRSVQSVNFMLFQPGSQENSIVKETIEIETEEEDLITVEVIEVIDEIGIEIEKEIIDTKKKRVAATAVEAEAEVEVTIGKKETKEINHLLHQAVIDSS